MKGFGSMSQSHWEDWKIICRGYSRETAPNYAVNLIWTAYFCCQALDAWNNVSSVPRSTAPAAWSHCHCSVLRRRTLRPHFSGSLALHSRSGLRSCASVLGTKGGESCFPRLCVLPGLYKEGWGTGPPERIVSLSTVVSVCLTLFDYVFPQRKFFSIESSNTCNICAFFFI